MNRSPSRKAKIYLILSVNKQVVNSKFTKYQHFGWGLGQDSTHTSDEVRNINRDEHKHSRSIIDVGFSF